MEEASVEVMEVVEAMAAVVEDIVVVEVDMVEVLRLPAMESETPRATGRDTQRRSCAQWTRTPAMWTWTTRWWTRWRRARASRLGYQLIRASDGKSKRSWRANKPPQDINLFQMDAWDTTDNIYDYLFLPFHTFIFLKTSLKSCIVFWMNKNIW